MLQKLDLKIELYKKIKERMSDFELNNWQEKFVIEYTHDSTAIEGNTLTLRQTKLVLQEKIMPAEVSLRDVLEVKAHGDAFDFIKEHLQKNTDIDENFIKDVHERVIPARGIGGIYRTVPVYITGSEHVPPNHLKVREQMKNFVADLATKNTSPIEKAAWIHAEIVKIHPFQDGNGRTCRLLLNYSLMKDGYPPVNIKKQAKEQYFAVLETYALKEDVQPFVKLLQNTMNKELTEFITMYKEHLKQEDFSDDEISQKLKKALFPTKKISK